MVTKKIKGLGRGLEALLGPTAGEAVLNAAGDAMPSTLQLDQMVAGVYQPRKRMDEGEYFTMEQAEAMLKQDGLLP